MILHNFFPLICDISFIIFPIVGFIPQIIKNKILFPPLLILLTIFTNIFKIIFYKEGDMINTILYQAILVIVFQFYLLYVSRCVMCKLEENIFKKRLGWLFMRYGIFTTCASISIMLVCTLQILSMFLGLPFIKLCGILSVFLEVSVGLIQLYINKERRVDPNDLIYMNNERVPKELYACWIIGDFCKLGYILYRKVPLLLTVSVLFQIAIDSLLLFEKENEVENEIEIKAIKV